MNLHHTGDQMVQRTTPLGGGLNMPGWQQPWTWIYLKTKEIGDRGQIIKTKQDSVKLHFELDVAITQFIFKKALLTFWSLLSVGCNECHRWSNELNNKYITTPQCECKVKFLVWLVPLGCHHTTITTITISTTTTTTATTTTTTTISGMYDARAGDGHVWLQWGRTAGTGHGQEDYTAVSVWLWDDKRSTSISGIVNSSMTLSAYSMEEVWDNRLLREDCFRRASASVAVSPYRASRPWRKALTTRIWNQKQTRKTYKIKNNHKGRNMLKKTSTCLEFWFTQNDCSYPVVSCCGSWALPALPMWPSNIHLNKIWAHTLLSLYHTVISLLKCMKMVQWRAWLHISQQHHVQSSYFDWKYMAAWWIRCSKLFYNIDSEERISRFYKPLLHPSHLHYTRFISIQPSQHLNYHTGNSFPTPEL